MSEPKAPITTYSEFWLFYLREHSRRETRQYHYAGTAAAILLFVAMLYTGNILLFVLALFAGYGPAWYAHFKVEKNRPATFRYPIWSLVSDFRMFGLWFFGRLKKELHKANLSSRR